LKKIYKTNTENKKNKNDGVVLQRLDDRYKSPKGCKLFPVPSEEHKQIPPAHFHAKSILNLKSISNNSNRGLRSIHSTYFSYVICTLKS